METWDPSIRRDPCARTHHENYSPQDPDIGTVRSINFPWLSCDSVHDRAPRFRLYQHPPVPAGRRVQPTRKGLGKFSARALWIHFGRNDVASRSQIEPCPWSFLPQSSYRGRWNICRFNVFSMRVFYCPFVESIGVEMRMKSYVWWNGEILKGI